jgi:hypothetical protein
MVYLTNVQNLDFKCFVFWATFLEIWKHHAQNYNFGIIV